MTKEQMGKILQDGTDAAKRLGGIACELGKKGFEAAREKVKALNERAKLAMEERRKAEEECYRRVTEKRRMEAEQERIRRQIPESTNRRQGEPRDKSFDAIRVGLYIFWWVGNLGYTFLCFKWCYSASESYFTRDSAWIPLALLPLLLFLNWATYELAVAIFEIVRHLRQIRDELRRRNMSNGGGRTVEAELGTTATSD